MKTVHSHADRKHLNGSKMNELLKLNEVFLYERQVALNTLVAFKEK